MAISNPSHSIILWFCDCPSQVSLLVKILCDVVLTPLGQVAAIFSSVLRESHSFKSLLSVLALQMSVDPKDLFTLHQVLFPHWQDQGDAIWVPTPLALYCSEILPCLLHSRSPLLVHWCPHGRTAGSNSLMTRQTLATSPQRLAIRIHGKQQICLDNRSDQQMVASIPGSRESPTASSSSWCCCEVQARPAQMLLCIHLPALHLLPGHWTYSIVAGLRTHHLGTRSHSFLSSTNMGVSGKNIWPPPYSVQLRV